MQPLNLDDVLDQIITRDPRFHRDAYCFVREALDHTQKLVARKRKGQVRHVTGQELLEGLREYALEQYGPMALTLLDDWGIRRCEDFGEVVFNLVEFKVLAKTDNDSRLDFQDGYDFEEAFRKPFLPESLKSSRARERPPKPTQAKRPVSPPPIDSSGPVC